MNYVVTGAAGFIGSTVCGKLVSLGHKVTGIDSFTEYYDPGIKRSNIAGLLAGRNFTLIEKDLLKIDAAALLRGADYVLHLAAQAGVRKSWGKEFGIYTDNNIMATQVLLEAAKGLPDLKNFVFASSSSIYGDTTEMPIKETTLPFPMSPYGVTKLAAERLTHLYWKNYGVPSVSLRFFSVYGPRQRPDMAFNIFTKKLLNNEPLPVFSDGDQTRDFTYVDDISEGLILAAESGCTGEIFNLGGGNRISLNEVIRKLGKIIGVTPVIQKNDSAKGDVRDTWADISKAKSMLKYSPKIKIDEGLMNEVDWIRKN